MIAVLKLLWLTVALATPCYGRDLPAPVLGYAYPVPVKIELDSRLVVPYVQYGLRGRRMTAARSSAVYVVAHELGHTRGHWTEAGADRWARVNWSYVVRRLGGTAAQALTSYQLVWGHAGSFSKATVTPEGKRRG